MSEFPVPDLSAVASPPRQSLTYEQLETAEEPLGAGGQAVVYEATISESDSPSKVALKEPKHEGTLTSEATEAFLQEITTWETIDRREREKPRWTEYEHIVGVIDSGKAHLPWIAMEYMDGGDLEGRLTNTSGGLPVDEALWIGECLCRGLEIADELGFSHLDIKPKNILFRETPEGTWDVPKLADWGIARTLAEETGTMEAQTVTYSAPEQFDPEIGDPDSLTDLYQVGAVVSEMLTGEPPYTGSNQQIMRQVLDNEPVPPSQHRGELSEAIDVTVTEALAKAKTDRYRGLQHFEEALRAVRTDSPLPHVVANQIESSSTRGCKVPDKVEHSTEDSGRTEAWPQFRNDATRTGHHPHASIPDRLPPVSDKWHFETGDIVQSSPAVVNDTVYIGSDDNNLYALDAKTGEKQWAFETGDNVRSSPAVADGTVYVGSHDHHLYALDAATGDQQWVFETGSAVLSSPAVADGIIFVGSDDTVYAVDAKTGDKHWAFETTFSGVSSPAVAYGTVYVGSHDNHLYALDAATGDKHWAFETGGIVGSSPTVADGTVYVGSCDKHVYALDAATGDKHWEFKTGGYISTSPAVADGTVYVGGDRDNQVHALDAATGDEQWAFETGGQVTSSPLVADGSVCVGSYDNHLYALDAATGDKQWMFETGDFVESSPAVADGTVFVGSWDEQVYALK